jgi:general secretion pathway protein F
MRFKAKVLGADARVQLVDVEAATEAEARRVAEVGGARVLSLHGERTVQWLPRRVGKFDLGVFNQQLHSLLEAGQTVVDSIEILGRNDSHGRHRAVYDTLLSGLRQGKQLSAAMEELPSVFPALYVAMLRASETTGSLRLVISRFMRYQKQVDEIRGKLVAAAVYPAVLLSVGGLVTAFLMLYVVPRFSEVFEDVKTKSASQGFVQMWGGFVREHTVLAWTGAAALLFGIACAALHPGLRVFLLSRILKLPLVGEKLWILHLARLYRTLGMLLKSGVSVIAAMRMTRDSLAAGMRADLDQAIVEISQGHALSSVFRRYQLSTEVADRLLLAGESSGNLDDMMERIADFYDQQIGGWVDTAGRLIEPLLMVGIGLVIGVVILMLYSPIFELANIA